jgi:hypothetical protein
MTAAAGASAMVSATNAAWVDIDFGAINSDGTLTTKFRPLGAGK